MNSHTQLTIRTPEGVVFSYWLAGPVTRALAQGVDLLAVALIVSGLQFGVAQLSNLSQDYGTAIGILLFFLVSIGYGILLEWLWQGQTLGKRLLRLRVMDDSGLRLQFHQLFIRNILRAVDSLPVFYFVGGVVALFSRRAQRLGDLAAGTVVTYTPEVREPDLEQLMAGRFNSLRRLPHLAARLRQRVTPEEGQLALRAILRRESYLDEERLKVFRALAGHFKEKVAFPAEDVETLPDEQFVRSVVDILFRSKPEDGRRREAPKGSERVAPTIA